MSGKYNLFIKFEVEFKFYNFYSCSFIKGRKMLDKLRDLAEKKQKQRNGEGVQVKEEAGKD